MDQFILDPIFFYLTENIYSIKSLNKETLCQHKLIYIQSACNTPFNDYFNFNKNYNNPII